MIWTRHDFIYDLLFVSSLLSIVGVGIMAYGYRSSLVSKDEVTRWFASSLVFLALAYALRRLTWDIAYPIYAGGANYSPINIVFNLINLVAVYYGLKARHLLIPESERHRWRWYTSWMHPHIFKFRVEPVDDRGDET